MKTVCPAVSPLTSAAEALAASVTATAAAAVSSSAVAALGQVSLGDKTLQRGLMRTSSAEASTASGALRGLVNTDSTTVESARDMSVVGMQRARDPDLLDVVHGSDGSIGG